MTDLPPDPFPAQKPGLNAARLAVFAALALCLPGRKVDAGGVVFSDVTMAAGVFTPQAVVPANDAREMTGGAAARDFDGDGWTDLLVTRTDANPILYRNMQNGTFQDVTAGSGIVMPIGSNGAAWGDVDNDGDPDLYLTRADADGYMGPSGSRLFINNGNGTFNDESAARGAQAGDPAVPRFGTGVAFGDYDRDGFLDLFSSDWGKLAPEVSSSRLLRNAGASAPGTFTDTTVAAGVALEGSVGSAPGFPNFTGVFSFSPRFTDLDHDGYPDLLMANDFGTSRVFWNNHDGTFTDGTAAAMIAGDENGMGLTVGDYNTDGLLDFFVTSIYHTDPPNMGHNTGGIFGVTGNRLYKNTGGRVFEDATDEAGVRIGHWGWGTSFFDYDNDGDLDLIMTNGSAFGDFMTDPSVFWENNGDGTFTEISVMAGITDNMSGKGLLTFDFDNDGDLDIFIANNSVEPILYRNDGEFSNDWIKIDLEGTVSNRDGIGALISVIPAEGEPMLLREIDGGSNYLAQSDLVAHFGLGDLDGPIHTVRVEWPSGTVQEFNGVAPNQRFSIVEPIPEPSQALLILLSLLGFSFRRKRPESR